MSFVEHILNLPYAYAWLPGLVFLAIVGIVYWLVRPTPAPVAEAKPSAAPPQMPALVMPKPRDMRGASRRPGNTIEVYFALPDNKKDPNIGSVLDRSMGGLRLGLYQQVETGTILSVRPVHADEMVPWIDIEVRSCKPSTEIPGQFEIGCQYVKSPPYSIQLLFG